jgi:hypothetical protein
MRLMMELLSRPDSCSRLDTNHLHFSFNIKSLVIFRKTGTMSEIEPGQYTIVRFIASTCAKSTSIYIYKWLLAREKEMRLENENG